MATLAETVTRTCDDLSRPEDDQSNGVTFASVVERELLAAIRFYESRRLGFNERVLEVTLSATYSYAFSALVANDSEVEDILAIDQIKVTYAGREYPLTKDTWRNLFAQDMLGITANLPDYWATFNKGLRLYPAPTGSLSAQISAHVKLILPSAATTNAWLTDAEELIRSRAAKNVCARKLQDFEGAQYYTGMENDALRTILHEAMKRRASGILAAND